MNIALLMEKLPVIRAWVDDTLKTYAPQAALVGADRFQKLPLYYPTTLLNSTRVVITSDKVVPPLSRMGLSEFADFEQGDYAGITYVNTCFIRPEHASEESLYFHELVHVIQWHQLGIDRFLLAYAIGLLQWGYRDSPLERMAYSHQANFEGHMVPYDVTKAVKAETDTLAQTLFGEQQSAAAQVVPPN